MVNRKSLTSLCLGGMAMVIASCGNGDKMPSPSSSQVNDYFFAQLKGVVDNRNPLLGAVKIPMASGNCDRTGKLVNGFTVCQSSKPGVVEGQNPGTDPKDPIHYVLTNNSFNDKTGKPSFKKADLKLVYLSDPSNFKPMFDSYATNSRVVPNKDFLEVKANFLPIGNLNGIKSVSATLADTYANVTLKNIPGTLSFQGILPMGGFNSLPKGVHKMDYHFTGSTGIKTTLPGTINFPCSSTDVYSSNGNCTPFRGWTP